MEPNVKGESAVRGLACALFLAVTVIACTQPAPLEVKDVWTRDSVGRTANAAVYMTIRSGSADRLVGASTPVAGKTDLMTMEARNGTMAMKYIEGIDIPAGEPVRLNARGLHVWLADLHRPLTAGQSIPLSLEFEKAGERQVTVSVMSPAAAPVASEMAM
jgi:copper(I)-binding protein